MKKTIAIIAIVAIVLWYYKKQTKVQFNKDGSRVYDTNELVSAFKTVAKQYGAEFARNLERLFRLETAHFTSGQFTRTLSAGMTAAAKKLTFPFGWSSLQEYANQTKINTGQFYTVFFENTSAGQLHYIGFPTVTDSILFTAWVIKNKKDGRFGYWNSLNETKAQEYEQKLQTITARFN